MSKRVASQEQSDKGKIAFTSKDYNTALDCYNKAIEIDDTVSVYYSNRARVNKMLGNLDNALHDAEKSTELDISNIKGYLLNGQIIALICQKNPSQISKLDTCIVRLTKALTLCAGQKMQKNEKYLYDNIKRVKKLKWFIQNQEQKEQDQKIINSLIENIGNQVEESEENKRKQINLVKLQLMDIIIRETLGEQENLFIPEYYLCKLTKNMLSDPVTTKFSNTYEKNYLEEYFKKTNSIRDPINQQLLQNPTTDILPNINLKKSIEEFLDQNPWAFEFKENQTINDMEF